MAAKSKKLLKVIENVRTWSIGGAQSSSSTGAVELDECLKSEHFDVGQISVNGFPYKPTCLAVDPVQRLIAVGTKSGSIRIFGRPGVDYLVNHPSTSAVTALIFLINEGGLISICQDDVVHLWNIRQKRPELVHSLQFKREHLTCGHVPIRSQWLYLGTDKGNVHVVNVQHFTTSGYTIKWNKAIDVSQSTHPGCVIQVTENPQDANKLLLGFDSGLVVLWDLQTKAVEARYRYGDNLNGFCWHWDGKSFMTCHNHGLLVTWSCRQPQQPISVCCPQAGDTMPEDCSSYGPISRVEWLPSKTGEPFVIFTGGCRMTQTTGDAPTDAAHESCPPSQSDRSNSSAHDPSSTVVHSMLPSLSVKRGKQVMVMQLDHRLVQFVSLSTSPYTCELMDPYAVVVLLQDDLVLVDLLSPNYPTFENPYPMDLHISPVTSCLYLVNCPGDFIPACYAVGHRSDQRRDGDGDTFSSREWPITGGEWGHSSHTCPELILTGHADGSVRFWDASEMTLNPLYKVRTIKYFISSPRNAASQQQQQHTSPLVDDVNANFSPNLIETEVDPYAIRLMQFCPESRRLVTASNAHVCLLHFTKKEQTYEIPVLDINMTYDCLEELPSSNAADAFSEDPYGASTNEFTRTPAPNVSRTGGSVSSSQSAFTTDRDVRVFVAVRPSSVTWPAGFQPSLVCRAGIPSFGSDPSQICDPTLVPPPSITAIGLNSTNGIIAMGNEYGFALVNYSTAVCLLTTATAELHTGVPDSAIRPPINRSSGRVTMGSPVDSKSSEKLSCSNSMAPLPPASQSATVSNRNQTSSADPPVQSSPDASSVCSPSSARYGIASKSATYRGELKRAKSQEKWSEMSGATQAQSFSASLTSLEQISGEGVKTFAFIDCQLRKQDTTPSLVMWVGTNRGNVIAAALNAGDLRSQHFVNLAVPFAFVYRLHGEIIHIGFLDSTGALLTSPGSKWEDIPFSIPRDKQAESSSNVSRAPSRLSSSGMRQGDPSVAARKLGMIADVKKETSHASSSSTSSSGNCPEAPVTGSTEPDKHLVVICSEKQACVLSIPSQTCISKVKITETSQVVRASVQRLRPGAIGDSVNNLTSFLACYLANGHFLAFSLPSLRMLMDVDYLPLTEHVSRSFAFGHFGQAVYLTTPSELVKITWSADLCSNLRDMHGDLFVPCAMPEPPKKGFLMNLISAAASQPSTDRNELFGEAASGKSAPGVSTLLPNTRMEKVTGQTGLATSEIARARNAAIERGDKLQHLDTYAQEMADHAKGMGRTAAALAAKYEKKDKRWGWPF